MTTIALAGAQQRLVDVVMKDPSEPLPIFAAPVARQRLSQSIANGVRMPAALALDDLDGCVGKIKLREH